MDNFSITEPENSSSTSIVTSSIGSFFTPSISLYTTLGREIDNSKPSRRIFSIRTPICNSPRPDTSNASPLAVSATFIATLLSHSFTSLSRITRLCTFLPSLPASGLSFMPNVTVIVGGSIGCEGIGSTTLESAIVSATVALLIPAIDTISPASAKSIACCFSPLNAIILLTLNVSITSPPLPKAFKFCPVFRVPLSTLPVNILPKKLSPLNVVASILKCSERCKT